jgi:hypothetical protein
MVGWPWAFTFRAFGAEKLSFLTATTATGSASGYPGLLTLGRCQNGGENPSDYVFMNYDVGNLI